MSDISNAVPAAPALKRRTWCYAYPPHVYAIGQCDCGSEKTTWSEFERHLWCFECNKDFIPKDGGVFDGPIPIMTAAMMGVRFDRIDLRTNKFERFDIEKSAYVDEDGNIVEELGMPLAAPAEETSSVIA